ncbi:MAG TPA: hypothetical protein VMQ67_08855, partial [Candidatus Saccharimonadales bacterium]|nr:hypothetical protein [Candidatus Saccharimonadales bacterium]
CTALLLSTRPRVSPRYLHFLPFHSEGLKRSPNCPFSGAGLTPPGNSDGLGVVQETIQDCPSRGHGAQELSPFLQWPVAGHDDGPFFIPAHDHLKKRIAGAGSKKMPSRSEKKPLHIA